MMSKKELNHIIMDLAEEDAYGLWEFLWQIQPAPGSERALVSRLSSALLSLNAEGMIDVMLAGGGEAPRLIAQSGVPDLLNDFKYWTSDVSAERHVEVVATDAGEGAWIEGRFRWP